MKLNLKFIFSSLNFDAISNEMKLVHPHSSNGVLVWLPPLYLSATLHLHGFSSLLKARRSIFLASLTSYDNELARPSAPSSLPPSLPPQCIVWANIVAASYHIW